MAANTCKLIQSRRSECWTRVTTVQHQTLQTANPVLVSPRSWRTLRTPTSKQAKSQTKPTNQNLQEHIKHHPRPSLKVKDTHVLKWPQMGTPRPPSDLLTSEGLCLSLPTVHSTAAYIFCPLLLTLLLQRPSLCNSYNYTALWHYLPEL